MNRLFLLFFLLLPAVLLSQNKMEFLTRGLHAVPDGKGNVLVSWRLQGTEDTSVYFNLYRSEGKKVSVRKTMITESTNYSDKIDTTKTYIYTVKAVIKGKEEKQGETIAFSPDTKKYLSIPLQTPAGYSANDASVGDMDGDGVYEIVLHMTGKARDNSQAGLTDPPVFQCYKLTGKLLWQINLGKNIREGAHYTQFMVYDFDSDGKAEIAMKTADGTLDGKGNVIGDSTKDFRNQRGHILSGPRRNAFFIIMKI